MQQLQQFSAMEALYREWNEKINVISRKDIDALYLKHVLHSLSIAATFRFQSGQQVLDIGTGGGFPGIPLAIFFPQVEFHLADSIGKKIKVVDAVVAALKLHNVTTQHIRVEEIRQRKFDVVVSRAVAPLKELWQWSQPMLKKRTVLSVSPPNEMTANGLICLKGGNLHEEIAQSGCKPHLIELIRIFPEAFFREKYLVQVPY